MSLDNFSIYQFCPAVEDDAGRLYLTDYVPFEFTVRDDNIAHTIRAGDSLWGLAAYYYTVVGKRANGWRYWKVVAHYQPVDGVRVHDPTVQLPVGKTLWLPSLRMIDTEILVESRRAEHDV